MQILTESYISSSNPKTEGQNTFNTCFRVQDQLPGLCPALPWAWKRDWKLKGQTETEWPGPEQLGMIGQVVKQEWRPWLKPLLKNTKLAFKVWARFLRGLGGKKSLLAKEKKIYLWATDQPTDQQFAVQSLAYGHMSRSDRSVFRSAGILLTHMRSAGSAWPTSGTGCSHCLLLDCAGPTIGPVPLPRMTGVSKVLETWDV